MNSSFLITVTLNINSIIKYIQVNPFSLRISTAILLESHVKAAVHALGTAVIICTFTNSLIRARVVICVNSQERRGCGDNTGDHQSEKSKNKEGFELRHFLRGFLLEIFCF